MPGQVIGLGQVLNSLDRPLEKDLRRLSICVRLDIEDGMWTWTMFSVHATSLRGGMGMGTEVAIEEGSLCVA